jgi:hypothetical protein
MTTISQSKSGPRDAGRSRERTVIVIEDGPACGARDASTFLMLVYSDQSGIHFFEKWYCCHRHVPHPADLLPEDAEVIETVIADARCTTIAGDGSAKSTMTFVSEGPEAWLTVS